jgi:hypothetical protein
MEYSVGPMCPVVSGYLRCLESKMGRDSFVYEGLVDELKLMTADNPRAMPLNRSTEMFRAFYCLNAMQRHMLTHLSKGVGCPDFEYTWVGVTRYIEYLRTLDRHYTTSRVINDFDSRRADATKKSTLQLRSRRLRDSERRVELVIEAAEFLRPKLGNQDSVGKSGNYLAIGLLEVSAPGEHFRNCLSEMLNIQKSPTDWFVGWEGDQSRVEHGE